MKTLLKQSLIIITALILTTVVACKKDDKKPEDKLKYTTSAETKPEFDNTNFGVYKGVIIGSSGTIKIEIKNGNDDVKITVNYNGKTDELFTTSAMILGQPINNAYFTGAFTKLYFSANAAGGEVKIGNLRINDSLKYAYAIHENSTSQISVYEGNFVNEDYIEYGTFNAMRIGNNSVDQGDNDMDYDSFQIKAIFWSEWAPPITGNGYVAPNGTSIQASKGSGVVEIILDEPYAETNIRFINGKFSDYSYGSDSESFGGYLIEEYTNGTLKAKYTVTGKRIF